MTHDEAMANAIPVVTSFVLTAEDKSEAPSSSPDSLLLAKLSLLFSKLSLSSSPDVPSTLQTPPPLSRSRMYCACIVWYEELPHAVSLAFLAASRSISSFFWIRSSSSLRRRRQR